MQPALVTESTVRLLASVADLPLAPGREAVIAPTLNAWFVMANELNRKMSEPGYWTIMPKTVFKHPGP